MSRILIIEDDIDLQEGLGFSLQTEGYPHFDADCKRYRDG